MIGAVVLSLVVLYLPTATSSYGLPNQHVLAIQQYVRMHHNVPMEMGSLFKQFWDSALLYDHARLHSLLESALQQGGSLDVFFMSLNFLVYLHDYQITDSGMKAFIENVIQDTIFEHVVQSNTSFTKSMPFNLIKFLFTRGMGGQSQIIPPQSGTYPGEHHKIEAVPNGNLNFQHIERHLSQKEIAFLIQAVPKPFDEETQHHYSIIIQQLQSLPTSIVGRIQFTADGRVTLMHLLNILAQSNEIYPDVMESVRFYLSRVIENKFMYTVGDLIAILPQQTTTTGQHYYQIIYNFINGHIPQELILQLQQVQYNNQVEALAMLLSITQTYHGLPQEVHEAASYFLKLYKYGISHGNLMHQDIERITHFGTLIPKLPDAPEYYDILQNFFNGEMPYKLFADNPIHLHSASQECLTHFLQVIDQSPQVPMNIKQAAEYYLEYFPAQQVIHDVEQVLPTDNPQYHDILLDFMQTPQFRHIIHDGQLPLENMEPQQKLEQILNYLGPNTNGQPHQAVEYYQKYYESMHIRQQYHITELIQLIPKESKYYLQLREFFSSPIVIQIIQDGRIVVTNDIHILLHQIIQSAITHPYVPMQYKEALFDLIVTVFHESIPHEFTQRIEYFIGELISTGVHNTEAIQLVVNYLRSPQFYLMFPSQKLTFNQMTFKLIERIIQELSTVQGVPDDIRHAATVIIQELHQIYQADLRIVVKIFNAFKAVQGKNVRTQQIESSLEWFLQSDEIHRIIRHGHLNIDDDAFKLLGDILLIVIEDVNVSAEIRESAYHFMQMVLEPFLNLHKLNINRLLAILPRPSGPLTYRYFNILQHYLLQSLPTEIIAILDMSQPAPKILDQLLQILIRTDTVPGDVRGSARYYWYAMNAPQQVIDIPTISARLDKLILLIPQPRNVQESQYYRIIISYLKSQTIYNILETVSLNLQKCDVDLLKDILILTLKSNNKSYMELNVVIRYYLEMINTGRITDVISVQQPAIETAFIHGYDVATTPRPIIFNVPSTPMAVPQIHHPTISIPPIHVIDQTVIHPRPIQQIPMTERPFIHGHPVWPVIPPQPVWPKPTIRPGLQIIHVPPPPPKSVSRPPIYHLPSQPTPGMGTPIIHVQPPPRTTVMHPPIIHVQSPPTTVMHPPMIHVQPPPPPVMHPPMIQVQPPPTTDVHPPMIHVQPRPTMSVHPPMIHVQPPPPTIMHPPMIHVQPPPTTGVHPPMIHVQPPTPTIMHPPMIHVQPPPTTDVHPPRIHVQPPPPTVMHPPMIHVQPPPITGVHPPMIHVQQPPTVMHPPIMHVQPPSTPITHPPLIHVQPPPRQIIPPQIYHVPPPTRPVIRPEIIHVPPPPTQIMPPHIYHVQPPARPPMGREIFHVPPPPARIIPPHIYHVQPPARPPMGGGIIHVPPPPTRIIPPHIYHVQPPARPPMMGPRIIHVPPPPTRIIPPQIYHVQPPARPPMGPEIIHVPPPPPPTQIMPPQIYHVQPPPRLIMRTERPIATLPYHQVQHSIYNHSQISMTHIQPGSSIRPMQPRYPMYPVQPIGPIIPIQQVHPIQPMYPVQQTRPYPVRPIYPRQPIQPVPMYPIQPIQPLEPALPMGPIYPVRPSYPRQPFYPQRPVQTFYPTQPIYQLPPTYPTQPFQPVRPVQPIYPGQPMHPGHPVQPMHPGHPIPTIRPTPPFMIHLNPTIPMQPTNQPVITVPSTPHMITHTTIPTTSIPYKGNLTTEHIQILQILQRELLSLQVSTEMLAMQQILLRYLHQDIVIKVLLTAHISLQETSRDLFADFIDIAMHTVDIPQDLRLAAERYFSIIPKFQQQASHIMCTHLHIIDNFFHKLTKPNSPEGLLIYNAIDRYLHSDLPTVITENTSLNLNMAPTILIQDLLKIAAEVQISTVDISQYVQTGGTNNPLLEQLYYLDKLFQLIEAPSNKDSLHYYYELGSLLRSDTIFEILRNNSFDFSNDLNISLHQLFTLVQSSTRLQTSIREAAIFFDNVMFTKDKQTELNNVLLLLNKPDNEQDLQMYNVIREFISTSASSEIFSSINMDTHRAPLALLTNILDILTQHRATIEATVRQAASHFLQLVSTMHEMNSIVTSYSRSIAHSMSQMSTISLSQGFSYNQVLNVLPQSFTGTEDYTTLKDFIGSSLIDQIISPSEMEQYGNNEEAMLRLILVKSVHSVLVSEQVKAAAAHLMRLRYFDYGSLESVIPAAHFPAEVNFRDTLIHYLTSNDIYYNMDLHYTGDTQLDILRNILTMIQTTENIPANVQQSATYYLNHAPFYNYGELVSLLPLPTSDNTKKLYNTLVQFLQSTEVNKCSLGIVISSFDGHMEDLLHQILFASENCDLIDESVRVAAKYYLNMLHPVSVSVQKIVTKTIDLNEVFSHVFDFSTFTKSQYDAYDAFVRYVQGRLQELLPSFDFFAMGSDPIQFAVSFLRALQTQATLPEKILGYTVTLQHMVPTMAMPA